MNKISNVLFVVSGIWEHVSFKRRRELFLYLAIMFAASVLEILTVSFALPLIQILIQPEKIYSIKFVNFLVREVHVSNLDQLLSIVVVAFVTIVFLSGAIRIILVKINSQFSFSLGADMSEEIYMKTLYQPYKVHTIRSTSEVITAIINKTNDIIYNAILPMLTIISSLLLTTVILIALAFINLTATLMFFLGFTFLYLMITRFTKAKLNKNSEIVSIESVKVTKSLQEGLGGARDIILDGTQQFYCDNFSRAGRLMRMAQGYNQFIVQCPRYLVETLGTIIIAVVAFNIRQSDVVGGIAIVGVLTLAAQRVLPLIQQAYSSWSAITGALYSLNDTLVLLNQKINIPKSTEVIPADFRYGIKLENVSFKYTEKSNLIFNNFNYEIKKGSRVGIIGKSGCGKSTLLDLIMALLPPTEGRLVIDGECVNLSNSRAWQMCIAHVPQNIFLSDLSIKENIAIGVELKDIDDALINKVINDAQLTEVIDQMPDGIKTKVGERGIRLSGGQRQRIGIARALYKKPKIIIFDEATSALDSETEAEVISAINSISRDITIIMVAHRRSTLTHCDEVLDLNKIKRNT